ncbi:MAG: hypothetical protein ACE5JH_07250 [Acidobacteriota bacterium]
MRDLGAVSLLGLLALLPGCADNTPARIEVEAPPIILRRSQVPIAATVVNGAGRPIAGAALSYSAEPADVVEVSASGSVRCLKTGDAALVLSAGGLAAEVPLKCRIATEIEMPERRRLLVGAGPVVLRARALTEGGRVMADVPVALTSSDPSVLRIDADAASPLSVGTAVLKASVGGITAVAAVEVVERIVSEPLTLADGQTRSWELRPGAYRVEIDVTPSHRVAQGVTASWEGARCEDQPERRSHRFSCAATDGAALSITNPATHGLGLTVEGTLTIYRVPTT